MHCLERTNFEGTVMSRAHAWVHTTFSLAGEQRVPERGCRMMMVNVLGSDYCMRYAGCTIAHEKGKHRDTSERETRNKEDDGQFGGLWPAVAVAVALPWTWLSFSSMISCVLVN